MSKRAAPRATAESDDESSSTTEPLLIPKHAEPAPLHFLDLPGEMLDEILGRAGPLGAALCVCKLMGAAVLRVLRAHYRGRAVAAREAMAAWLARGEGGPLHATDEHGAFRPLGADWHPFERQRLISHALRHNWLRVPYPHVARAAWYTTEPWGDHEGQQLTQWLRDDPTGALGIVVAWLRMDVTRPDSVRVFACVAMMTALLRARGEDVPEVVWGPRRLDILREPPPQQAQPETLNDVPPLQALPSAHLRRVRDMLFNMATPVLLDFWLHAVEHKESWFKEYYMGMRHPFSGPLSTAMMHYLALSDGVDTLPRVLGRALTAAFLYAQAMFTLRRAIVSPGLRTLATEPPRTYHPLLQALSAAYPDPEYGPRDW